MEQKDYLLREIEKIGRMIAAVRQKIFGGNEPLAITLDQQIKETKDMLLNNAHFDLDKFMTLNSNETEKYLNDIKGFNVENIELLARLIAQIGFSENSEKARKYLEKALQLYELCNLKDKTYSLERNTEITAIKKCPETANKKSYNKNSTYTIAEKE
jgi:hypothetical protein